MRVNLHYGFGRRYATRLQCKRQREAITNRLFQTVPVRTTSIFALCCVDWRVAAGGSGLELLALWMKIQPSLYSRILYDSNVSAGAFRLWHALRDRTGNNDCCWPSCRKLAADLHCGLSSVTQWIDELRATGYVRVERGNHVKSNRYFLRVPNSVHPVPDNKHACSRRQLKGVPESNMELNSGNLKNEPTHLNNNQSTQWPTKDDFEKLRKSLNCLERK